MRKILILMLVFTVMLASLVLAAAPNEPSNLQPPNNSVQTPDSVNLSADVSDPDGDSMDVSFYRGVSWDIDYGLFLQSINYKDDNSMGISWNDNDSKMYIIEVFNK